MRPSDPFRRASLLERATLVLNRSWRPVHVTTVRRALCMLFREAARVVHTDTLTTFTFEEWLDQPISDENLAIRSPSVQLAVPEVILLVHYDRIPCHEAPFTRRNLFLRDDFTCQYCGTHCNSDHLSVDHVLPRSRGGSTSWENCVLACVRCNAKKADRTLKEIGFRLLRPPVRPRWTPYLNLRPSQRMESWSRFAPDQKRRSASGS
ncbi:MAG: HNH endonuclease [Planctomycetes bacterium]|nr:HNH endonuclease [Planctomycetota bacterium]